MEQGVWTEGQGTGKRATGFTWSSRVPPSAALSQGASFKGSWKKELRKTEAKVFKDNVTLIRWLPAYANIGGLILKNSFNKSNGNFSVFTCSGNRGKIFLRALSLYLPVPLMSRSVEQMFGQGIWGIWWI